jgi:RNA polymerase sigma-70 factor (ECF subfamily)
MDIPVTANATLQHHFADLLQQHQGIVLKVARAWSQAAEDRRDLVQDISIQAWRGFASFDPDKARFGTCGSATTARSPPTRWNRAWPWRTPPSRLPSARSCMP